VQLDAVSVELAPCGLWISLSRTCWFCSRLLIADMFLWRNSGNYMVLGLFLASLPLVVVF
jgi:hypothetical protein